MVARDAQAEGADVLSSAAEPGVGRKGLSDASGVVESQGRMVAQGPNPGKEQH